MTMIYTERDERLLEEKAKAREAAPAPKPALAPSPEEMWKALQDAARGT